MPDGLIIRHDGFIITPDCLTIEPDFPVIRPDGFSFPFSGLIPATCINLLTLE
jgi:hypothetical protein